MYVFTQIYVYTHTHLTSATCHAATRPPEVPHTTILSTILSPTQCTGSGPADRIRCIR